MYRYHQKHAACLINRPAKVVYSLLAHGGVSGAVGDEKTVVPLLLDVPVPRNNRQLAKRWEVRALIEMKPILLALATFMVGAHLDALRDERADDVIFDTAIDGHNVHISTAVRLWRPVSPPTSCHAAAKHRPYAHEASMTGF